MWDIKINIEVLKSRLREADNYGFSGKTRLRLEVNKGGEEG